MKRIEKLSRKEQDSLVYDLVMAVVTANSISDAALFLQDLLTKTEIKTLGKRLRIAKLLISGMTYRDVEDSLSVSHGTVAKVATWLSEQGEGFRKVIKKIPNKVATSWEEKSDWDRIKRRYSMYFWPELLLEEIIKNANKRQQQRIQEVLSKLDQKSELYKRIDKLLTVSTAT